MIDTQQEFYDFVAERTAIREEKYHGAPRPWTSDPVLDRNFFCNARRRDDTGTQYWFEILNDLQDRHGNPDMRAVVFHATLYRGFNLIGTSQAIVDAHGGLAATYLDYNPGTTIDALAGRRTRGEKVFTGAFMTAGLVNAAQTLTGLRGDEAVAHYFAEMKPTLEEIGDTFSQMRFTSLQFIYQHLRVLAGFGRFLAYQTALDVNYAMGGSEDDFTVLGPGADAGLRAIFGDSIRTNQLMDLCKKVRDEQPAEWGPLVVEGVYTGGRLSLCDVEHSLCEFAKYHRIKHGTGAGTRVYRPGQSR